MESRKFARSSYLTSPLGRIAYCTVPKIGGTYNFYRNLRGALAGKGWDVVAPVVGRQVHSLWDRSYPADGCYSVAPDETDPRVQAQSLVAWCEAERIDILIPMSVPSAVSAIPHLPSSVRPVMRASNITRHAYDIVAVHLDRVCRVVATSQRQFDDLLHQRRVPAEKLALIPHGIDTAAFEEAHRQRERFENQPLRIGYLGRLLDSAKGIYLLPKIMCRLDQLGTQAHLTVVGDGPDRQRLERRLDPWIADGRAVMMGRRHQSDIPQLLSQWDVLLMPSSFEGFGFSLIEGMAAGLVPVVSKIAGVTDWIVQDGSTGFVCPIGDATSFADRIHLLATNRRLLATMSHATYVDARSRFSLTRMGDDYHALFESVMAEPDGSQAPAPWSQFELCRGFEPTFRRWIPEPVKARLRALLERWRARK